MKKETPVKSPVTDQQLLLNRRSHNCTSLETMLRKIFHEYKFIRRKKLSYYDYHDCVKNVRRI